MQLSFAFSTDLVRVFRTSWGDVPGVFIDTPLQFADSPAGLGILSFVDHTVHAKLDEEGADGVNDLAVDDIDGEVCGRENADGLFLWGRLKGTLDAEGIVEG